MYTSMFQSIRHKTFLSFCLEGNLVQFICFPFGLAPVLRTVTKAMKPALELCLLILCRRKFSQPLHCTVAKDMHLANQSGYPGCPNITYITMVFCYLHCIDPVHIRTVILGHLHCLCLSKASSKPGSLLLDTICLVYYVLSVYDAHTVHCNGLFSFSLH